MNSKPLRVFVSYRRGDSGHAGRLYDALAVRFGPDNVFMDIDTIDPGVDFVDVIHRAVSSCDVVIALIGRGWLSALDVEGGRRLDNPDDFVRLELEGALARDVVVVPACVQGAKLPSADELPPSLAPLARRQAVELRDVGWHDDVERLIRRLERTSAAPADAKPVEAVARRHLPAKHVLAVAGGALALAGIAVAVAVSFASGGDEGASTRPSQGAAGGAEERLLAVVPAVTRSSCQRIDYGEESALASVTCSGIRLAVTYHLFPSNAVMDAWFSQERELARIQPGSGSCEAGAFHGEVRYAVGGRTQGSSICFASDGAPELLWTDRRVSVGAEANIWEGTGRAAAASLLRQWRCCLQLEP